MSTGVFLAAKPTGSECTVEHFTDNISDTGEIGVVYRYRKNTPAKAKTPT